MFEGPGSLLKRGGRRPLDRSLFRDTQLDPGDSALSLWSWPLQTQTCFYSEHIIHWFILWGFSLELHMFVAGLLLCVWGSRFFTEERRKTSFGPVTLQRHTAGPWRLCSQSLVLTSANTNMFLFRTHHSLVHSLRIQFGASHVCSRSITLCLRVQVLYWREEEDVLWTGHSSEKHSWTLETLLSVSGPDLCKHKHVFIQNTSFTGSFSEDSIWSFTCL